MTDDLVGRLAALVRADCPQGWVRADLRVTVGYSHTLTVLMADREVLQGRPAAEVDPLLRDLRDADGGLVFPVTGGTFPWTPPAGLVPAGVECRIEHRGGFKTTRQAGP